MKPTRIACVLLAAAGVSGLISCSTSKDGWLPSQTRSAGTETAQVPRWSEQDLDVFLHGSMSTEVVPETVLRAFIAFFGSVMMAGDPIEGERMQPFYADEWQRQESRIIAAIGDDPSGSKGLTPGALHPLAGEELRFGHSSLAHANLAALSHSMLKLFHNMRTALHVPDQPPEKLPPPSGPGRNDAFGLLSAALFGAPQPYSPVKYGLVWNLENRHWVH